MEDAPYLRQQAGRCFEIGRACMDLDASRKINGLGDEFRAKALELEGRRGGAGFRPGDSDRDAAA
jgi:hypothetical protein